MTEQVPAERRATIKEASAYSGVPEGTLRRWISERRLTAYRVGPRKLQVDLNDVDRLRRPVHPVEPEQENQE